VNPICPQIVELPIRVGVALLHGVVGPPRLSIANSEADRVVVLAGLVLIFFIWSDALIRLIFFSFSDRNFF
jgi:hypothetical protein